MNRARRFPTLVATAASFAAASLLVPNAGAVQSTAYVVTSDFSTGSLSRVTFGPPRVPTNGLASVCADPVVRFHQGLLYVVGRFGCDHIHVIDPANSFATVRQFSVGNGANPHDIQIVSPTKAYVTRYESADLWIVDPSSGTVLDTLSLAGFADGDGIPEMDHLAFRNGLLFVTVQRLDRDGGFVPTDSSQVAVLDVATDTWLDRDPLAPGVQGILLPFQNPTTEIVLDPAGRLVVGCTGAFGVADGGIARVDPIGLRLDGDGLEVTEATLGGDVTDVAVATPNRGFAVVGGPAGQTALVAYDRVTHGASGTVFATPGFDLADSEVNDRAEVWLCDRSIGGPGLRVYDALTLAPLTAGPIPTDLPPVDLTFDGSAVTAAGESGGPGGGAERAGVSVLGVAPNPSSGEAAVRYRIAAASAAGAGRVTVRIVAPSGRQVRRLERAFPGAGDHTMRWDGRDEAGRLVPAGVYSFELELEPASAGGRSRATGRLVRLPGSPRRAPGDGL